MTDCHHYFCTNSVNTWIRTSETCPYCRQELRSENEWWIDHLIKVKERLQRDTLALRVMPGSTTIKTRCCAEFSEEGYDTVYKRNKI